MSGTSEPTMGKALIPAPLYAQVSDRITERVVNGIWPEGFVLPPEAELARQMAVSEGTVRRAMQNLTQEGVLMRRPRTGTVVTGRTPQHTLDRYYKYYRLHSMDGHLINTDTRVVSLSRRSATAEEARRLKITSGEDIGAITRLRLYEERPVMIDRIVLPLRRLSSFPQRSEDMPPLIFSWLLCEHGLRLGALRERVTARIADEEDRELLGLCDPAPVALLEIDEIAYDPTNEPLLLMRHSALTDAHCYVNEVR